MKKVKGYRNIFEKNRILGLEFLDLLVLLTAYLVIFLLSKNIILNLILIGLIYFLLRIYKKGKPRHWSGSVIRFLVTPRTYRLDREINPHE